MTAPLCEQAAQSTPPLAYCKWLYKPVRLCQHKTRFTYIITMKIAFIRIPFVTFYNLLSFLDQAKSYRCIDENQLHFFTTWIPERWLQSSILYNKDGSKLCVYVCLCMYVCVSKQGDVCLCVSKEGMWEYIQWFQVGQCTGVCVHMDGCGWIRPCLLKTAQEPLMTLWKGREGSYETHSLLGFQDLSNRVPCRQFATSQLQALKAIKRQGLVECVSKWESVWVCIIQATRCLCVFVYVCGCGSVWGAWRSVDKSIYRDLFLCRVIIYFY